MHEPGLKFSVNEAVEIQRNAEASHEPVRFVTAVKMRRATVEPSS